MKTHQEIVDALEAIAAESNQARSQIDAAANLRRKALREECGRIGHVFGVGLGVLFGPGRQCVFCYAAEPATEEKVA